MQVNSAIKTLCCCSRGNGDVGIAPSSNNTKDKLDLDESGGDLAKWLESNILNKGTIEETTKSCKPGTWVEIRLFISSTFIDTHSERDILIRRVIPSINRKIASKFIRVIPVDLRWGVSAEESKDCFQIQKTCLNQLDKCREDITWTPWFLGLRTQRYGWVQDQYMNSNGFECPELFDWLDKMQDFSQVSITSLECIHAARLSSSRTPRPTVFFYERQIVEDAKHKIPDDRRWIFDFEFVNKEIKNPDRKHQYTLDKEGATAKKDDRDKLNEFLKSQDHIIYRDYTSRYSHSKITGQRGDGKKFGVGYTKKLEEFQSGVENDLLSAILENYDQFDNSQMDKFQLESIQHENAVREKASMFVGREDLIGTAQRFLEKEHKMMRTMILHGEPGCGKSGLLAALAHQTIEKYRKNGDFVFVHIVDSCPGSALLEGFLRRLNVSLRIFRRAQGETNLDKNPPKEASKLKDEHHSFMNESAQKYPNTKFIIIVDAVNQLNSSMLAWDMWWLSNQAAPTNLKFLISTLNEENKTFENALEMCINAVCVPVLEMKRADLKAMVRGALQRFNKKLTETNDPLLGNQMDILVNKSTSPLYLMAACEALRRFGIFEKVTEYLISLPSTVPSLFEFLLDEWSEEYGKGFVQDVVGMICVSKDGLLENQIQDALSFKERLTGQAYDASFSRIYDSLASFLAAGGGGYLRFFHDQLKYAVARKFIKGDFERETHSLLAKFHLSVINTQYAEVPEVKPIAYYEHSLNQLVHHQINAHVDGTPMYFLKDSLRNIYFVREKIKVKQQQQLNDDYRMVQEKCTNEKDVSALADWLSFSQMYCASIQEFDIFALNMAKNQAKNSFVKKDVGVFNMESNMYYPLLWKNSPSDVDPMVVKYAVGGTDICARSGGEIVAIGTSGKILRMSSGETVQTLSCGAVATMLSEDSEKLLAGCSDGTVKVVDVSTGIVEIECEKALGEYVSFVHWNEDIIIAATGSDNGAICWDDHSSPVMVLVANRNDGTTIKSWSTGEPGFNHCFSSSLNMIFTGHKGGLIIGWDLDGKEVVRQNNDLGQVVYSLASHDSEALILSGSNDHVIREWKVSKENNKMTLVNQIQDSASSGWFYGGNWSISYDHGGDRILSTEPISQSLRMFHKNGSLLEELRGHQDCINKISLVDDGKHVVTCDRGNMSILWKLPETFTSEEKVEKIDDGVNWCEFSPDGSMYLTVAEGALRIFDTATQKVIHSKSGVCNHYRGSGKWMPNGKHFVVISGRTTIAWFDCELNKLSEVECFETDDSSCTDLALRKDGKIVVVVDCRNSRSEDSGATIVDCSDTQNPFIHAYITDYGARMFSCDINDSGELLAIAGHRGTVVYDLNTLERKYSIESGCFFVKFKSDNKLLYESDDGLSLYDSEKDEEISRYVGHYCTVNHACFLNDDKLIMSAGSEGTLRLYDTSTSKNLYTFFSHQAQGFNYIDVHPNEKMIIAADDSKTLYILSPED